MSDMPMRPQDPASISNLDDRTDHNAAGTEMVESPRRNGRATSRENLHGAQNCYDYGGTTSGNGSSNYNEDDEDQIIDILARLGDGGDDDQCDGMVTQEEDGWAKTVAGVAGNVLEWYDFAVFGYFSDILSDVFFPPDQEGHAALVESFAVFGGAFLMRPLGGVMMGYLGDRYGSRRALTASIFLMAFPTFCMGCLPGYAAVGPLSIVLLTIVRLMQGLSVGGQLMSSLVFTLERHPKSSWGLYGSFVMAAANCGTLLGGFVATVMRRGLSDEALHQWGWRVPFLSGILVSVSGFYLRSHGGDDGGSHLHGTTTNAAEVNPIKLAFSRGNLRSLLAASLVPLLWSCGFYLTFVWAAIYMKDLVETPVPNSFMVNSASLGLSVCLLFSVAGWLSDKVGRKRIMAAGGILLGLCYPGALKMMGSGNYISAFAAQTSLGILLSMWGAPMMAWLYESFDPSHRLTSVSIGYNIAQFLGGGLSPAIATEMVDRLGPDSPGYYVLCVSSVAIIGLLCVAPRRPMHFSVIQGDDIDLGSNVEEEREREII